MTIQIPAHRNTFPIYYEIEGKKFVYFHEETNHTSTITLPVGSRVLTAIGDLIGD